MPANDVLEERLFEAALRCIARWGIAKTTLDDVAREAGCSRATIYRTFSGGKSALLARLLDREVSRCLAAIDAAVVGEDDLESVLSAGISAAARFIAEHEPLQFLLAHEPDVILPMVSFHRLDALFEAAGRVAGPHLAPFLPESEVDAAAEWVARVVLSYTLQPDPTLDLGDPADARRLVSTYLIPGFTVVPAS